MNKNQMFISILGFFLLISSRMVGATACSPGGGLTKPNAANDFVVTFDTISSVGFSTYTAHKSAVFIKGTTSPVGDSGSTTLRVRLENPDLPAAPTVAQENKNEKLRQCAKSARMMMLLPGRFKLYFFLADGNSDPLGDFPATGNEPSCQSWYPTSFCRLDVVTPTP